MIRAVPNPPSHLSLSEILANTVVVMWDADANEQITLFEMTIRPFSGSPRLIKAHLDGTRRSYLVNSLYPETEYQLAIAAHNADGMSNVSDVITFRTLEASAESYLQRPDIHPGEVLIVVLILVAWFCAIALFLHKWGKLHMLQNDQPRFNHSPKNIETIKVVKQSTDSVIHKNYSTQHTKTMIAREKRIARMNTMPNIKLNIKETITKPPVPPVPGITGHDNEEDTKVDLLNGSIVDKSVEHEKHKYKVFSRTITSPVLEVDESHSSNA